MTDQGPRGGAGGDEALALPRETSEGEVFVLGVEEECIRKSNAFAASANEERVAGEFEVGGEAAIGFEKEDH